MSTVKIKQLNNDAASSGNVITFDGTDNVWAAPPSGGLTTVTAFAGLPGSPSTNDVVFYTPFNSILVWDGTHWVGPKISGSFFGREGTGNGDVWLQAIGRASAYPDGSTTHGYTIPNITEGSGTSKWKLYNMSIGSVNVCTGDMELHADATATTPVFGTTGLGSISMTADRRATSDFTPTTINGGQTLQCFWRRTSGGWKAWTTTFTFSWVAAA